MKKKISLIILFVHSIFNILCAYLMQHVTKKESLNRLVLSCNHFYDFNSTVLAYSTSYLFVEYNLIIETTKWMKRVLRRSIAFEMLNEGMILKRNSQFAKFIE